ncbi:MAG: class B sortase [Oscillospiraceae bacterium]
MPIDNKDNNTSGGARFAASADKPKSSFAQSFIPSKEDSGKVKARKIAVLIVIVALLAALVFFLASLMSGSRKDTPDTAEGTELETNVITEVTTEATTVTTTVPETETETETTTTPPPPLVMREDIASYVDQNPDTAGWLTVGGTAINSVILQGEDNAYYLNHTFYGGSSQAGSLYADYRCIINDYDFNQSDNVTIYGHNQADGSMFGTLQYYKVTKQNTSRFSFYQDHPTFTFSNLYEEYTYKIVAVFVSESKASQARDGIIFDPHNFVRFKADSSHERSFESFVKNINERTEILTGVDMEKGDKFMTLSTCSNEFDDSRFIVIGRRVRDGESPEVDTSLAQLNPNVKEPDWNFIYNGN